MARLYSKGQVTIPKQVREQAGLAPGDQVVVTAENGSVVIRKPKGVLEFEAPPVKDSSMSLNEARRVAREERIQRRLSAGSSDRS